VNTASSMTKKRLSYGQWTWKLNRFLLAWSIPSMHEGAPRGAQGRSSRTSGFLPIQFASIFNAFGPWTILIGFTWDEAMESYTTKRKKKGRQEIVLKKLTKSEEHECQGLHAESIQVNRSLKNWSKKKHFIVRRRTDLKKGIISSWYDEV